MDSRYNPRWRKSDSIRSNRFRTRNSRTSLAKIVANFERRRLRKWSLDRISRPIAFTKWPTGKDRVAIRLVDRVVHRVVSRATNPVESWNLVTILRQITSIAILNACLLAQGKIQQWSCVATEFLILRPRIFRKLFHVARIIETSILSDILYAVFRVPCVLNSFAFSKFLPCEPVDLNFSINESKY